MVNKQIFLMSGFPRSGTTLLSTLLNQRPDMSSGPQSPLIHAMGEVYNLYSKLENLDVKVDADIFNIEVLASYNKLAHSDINNSRDIEVNRDVPGKALLADKRATYWMESEYSDIRAVWQGLHRALEPQYSPMFYFMEYNDLTSKPQETLDNISDFLGIERYEHDLSRIENKYTYNDVFGFKDHHVVRNTIEKTSDDPYQVFSEETIKKYSNLEFWRNK